MFEIAETAVAAALAAGARYADARVMVRRSEMMSAQNADVEMDLVRTGGGSAQERGAFRRS